MPIDMELFKYGYRNKPRTLTMGVLGILATLLGFTIYTTDLELQNVSLIRDRMRLGLSIAIG